MNPFRPFAFIFLAATGAAFAQPDPGFGQDGAVTLGFQPVGSGASASADIAYVACAGPSGSLMVSGRASGGRRIVTAWLDDRGVLDTRFSGDGKESITLHDGERVVAFAVGLCMADGDALLAFEMYDSATLEGDIQLLRIDAASGLGDPAFGVGGRRVLDLDQYAAAPIGGIETPLAINFGVDGELLLSGSFEPAAPYSPSANEFPFVARIGAADGALRAVQLLVDAQRGYRRAVAAMPAEDGTVWLATVERSGDVPNGLSVLRLDPASLAPRDVLLRRYGNDYFGERGVRLPDGRFAIAGHRRTAGIPFVAIIDATGATAVELPEPAGAERVVALQVAPLADGDLLLGGWAVGPENRGLGAWFARVARLGNAALLPVTGFGSGGSTLLQAAGPTCAAPSQSALRFTLWRGRPTAVGGLDASCGSGSDVDYLVLRQLAPAFGDGFE